MRQDIEFSSENLNLRGWLYKPSSLTLPVPGIIMTHGLSALKEHDLDKFAQQFVAAGMCVLIYDNRNFGSSDGEPRLEVNPVAQIRDLRHAITFLQKHSFIDPEKIILWGTSLSAGNALVAAAEDDRVKCVIAQTPFVLGFHRNLQKNRPDALEAKRKAYAEEKQSLLRGESPKMLQVVTADPEKSAIMKQPSAYEFFTSLSYWKNAVTFLSLEHVGDFHPMDVVDKISCPVLFVVADKDTVNPIDLDQIAYEKISAPKKWVEIRGEHFEPYRSEFEVCWRAACDWLTTQGLLK